MKAKKTIKSYIINGIKILIFLPILLFVSFFILLDILFFAEESTKSHRIHSFYKDAGFKGEVVDIKSRMKGFSIDHSYTYKEDLPDKDFEVSYSKVSSIGDKEGELIDTQDELAERYDSYLVHTLFEKAFERSSYFQKIEKEIAQSLIEYGINQYSIYSYIRNSTNREIVTELKSDLKNRENNPVRGLLELDFEKYVKLGMYELKIMLNEEIPIDFINKFNITNLPDAEYHFYYKNGSWSVTRLFYIIIKNGEIIKIVKY